MMELKNDITIDELILVHSHMLIIRYIKAINFGESLITIMFNLFGDMVGGYTIKVENYSYG